MSEQDWECMVLDLSCLGVRRYWNGEGWAHDPALAFRTIHFDDAWPKYNYLVQNHCSVALVHVWWSRDIIREVESFRGVSVVHRILVIESVRYFD
jgi:hypothetical protein